MVIKKRTLPKYILLNCLTLGIYGFIVSRKIGEEINALCKGDGESPRFGYTGAVMFRAISPFVGIILGLILSLVGMDNIDVFGIMSGEITTAAVFAGMLSGGIVFTLIGTLISGIYLNYWWYKQASRLKLNANRYGITVKESGTDTFIYRTVFEIVLIPISIVLIALSCIIPFIIIRLILLAESTGAVVAAIILLFVFALPLMIFGKELTAGSNFAVSFIFKNLNRFADVYKNGAAPFDPMGYQYYPSLENKYPNFVPGLINNGTVLNQETEDSDKTVDMQTDTFTVGTLIGLKGSCAGYNFELTSGEEIVIGKNAKVSSVVIDPAFKEISRKHCGVCYDIISDQYRVVDYSSNGTWANEKRLIPGQAEYLPRGTELKLANDKNIFRLG